MPAVKVGVRDFREQLAHYLESETPVAVTRRGETIGIYVPTPRRKARTADAGDLRAAADRLADALREVGEEQFAAEFNHLRRPRRPKAK